MTIVTAFAIGALLAASASSAAAPASARSREQQPLLQWEQTEEAVAVHARGEFFHGYTVGTLYSGVCYVYGSWEVLKNTSRSAEMAVGPIEETCSSGLVASRALSGFGVILNDRGKSGTGTVTVKDYGEKLGFRTGYGCVYEAVKMSSPFQFPPSTRPVRLAIGVRGTFHRNTRESLRYECALAEEPKTEEAFVFLEELNGSNSGFHPWQYVYVK